MSKQLSAHQFKQVFEDLGYDLAKLGCIMLDLYSGDLEAATAGTIADDDFYYAKDLTKFWINGLVANKAHVTLLYGLLRSGLEMKKHVDTVVGELPQVVEIDHINYFDSPYEDEPYYCIVAHMKLTDELVGVNERLKFLPHINTFPGYKAHATLAYIKKLDESKRDSYVTRLNNKLAGKLVKTGSLDYGGNKP